MQFEYIIYIIDWVLFIITTGTVIYLGVFTIASLFRKSSDIPKAKTNRRFIILIPSYKQDEVIEQTVVAILAQSYPQRMFDVIVKLNKKSKNQEKNRQKIKSFGFPKLFS